MIEEKAGLHLFSLFPGSAAVFFSYARVNAPFVREGAAQRSLLYARTLVSAPLDGPSPPRVGDAIFIPAIGAALPLDFTS